MALKMNASKTEVEEKIASDIIEKAKIAARETPVKESPLDPNEILQLAIENTPRKDKLTFYVPLHVSKKLTSYAEKHQVKKTALLASLVKNFVESIQDELA